MTALKIIGFVIYTFIASYLLFGAGIDYNTPTWWNVPLGTGLVIGWVAYLTHIIVEEM